MIPIVPACLTDFIGIEPCEGESTFLRDLTELEGLSIASIAATADPAKWASAKSEVAAMIPLGVSDVISHVKALMTAHGVNMLRQVDTGEFCYFGTIAQTGLVPGDGGLYIQKNTLLQPTAQPIRVKWITLKSPNLTVNIPLRITDEAGLTLWSTTVASLPANTEFQVPVNVDFYENKIKILIEGTAMQGYYASCAPGTGSCTGCTEPPYSSPYSVQRSAFFVNSIEGGVVGGFKSPGITAAIELPCLDSLFCKYGAELAPAFIYAVGVRILRNWEASTRLNVFALKKEWAATKIAEWAKGSQQAPGMDYLVRLVLPGIMDDLLMCYPRCFKCEQPFGFIPFLP